MSSRPVKIDVNASSDGKKPHRKTAREKLLDQILTDQLHDLGGKSYATLSKREKGKFSSRSLSIRDAVESSRKAAIKRRLHNSRSQVFGKARFK